jgi:error-prone DNA polymerase
MIESYAPRPLLHMPPTDEGVYEMMCRADTIGVFQVESRAQMAMLPRLQPRCFYDLAVQVAIVRPGPIQGGMVHPYLRQREARRREGKAFRVHYPSPAPPHPPEELKPVLDRTLGVPIFQEQAMQIAMVAAEFSGDEANGLRRAMATFRHLGTMPQYEKRMVGRMIERGYDPEFAQSCFDQIKGFGEYGFPESHAASFAHLVYVSAWIKHHHPAAFAAALLNSQPMGFYAPAQIIRCAREHGVRVLHPDVNVSVWDNVLEDVGGKAPSVGFADSYPKGGASVSLDPPPLGEVAAKRPEGASLRLGLRQIGGFKEAWATAIELNRPFASLDDLRLRAGLPARALELLAGADALGSLKLSRRGGLWAARGLPRAAPAPLFAAAGIDEADGAPPTALPAMSEPEEVVGDYESLRLSLKAHPVSFLRERLAQARILPCAGVAAARMGARVSACGVVLVRQRPGSAKGVCFITLEDETGIANLVVWPKVFEEFRPQIMSAKMLLAHGRIQRAADADGGVTHLVVERLEDRTGDLLTLATAPVRTPRAPGDEPGAAAPSPAERHRHPRDVRLLPRSRDFH